MVEETKKIKCIYCGSSFGYLKVKDKIWQCRSCGSTFKVDNLKEVEGKEGVQKE